MTRLHSLVLKAIDEMNNGLLPEDEERGRFFMSTLNEQVTVIAYGNIYSALHTTGFRVAHISEILPPDEKLSEKNAVSFVQAQIVNYWKDRIQIPIAKIKTEAYSVLPQTRQLIDGIVDLGEAMKNRLIFKEKTYGTSWTEFGKDEIVSEIYHRLKRVENRDFKALIGIANYALIGYMHTRHTFEDVDKIQFAPEVESKLAEEFSGTEPEVIDTTKDKTIAEKEPTHYSVSKGQPYRFFGTARLKVAGVIDMIERVTGRKILIAEDERTQFLHGWLDINLYENLSKPEDGLRARTILDFNSTFTTQIDQNDLSKNRMEEAIDLVDYVTPNTITPTEDEFVDIDDIKSQVNQSEDDNSQDDSPFDEPNGE